MSFIQLYVLVLHEVCLFRLSTSLHEAVGGSGIVQVDSVSAGYVSYEIEVQLISIHKS